MRNCDYYNNPTDLKKAFEEYCTEVERQGIRCEDCQLFNNPTVDCRANFTYAEHQPDLIDRLILKRCPFCNGYARLRHLTDKPEKYWAGCDACNISTDFVEKEEAIEKWNRRDGEC